MKLDPTIATEALSSRVRRMDQDRVAYQTQSPLAALWQKAAAVDSTLALEGCDGAQLRRTLIRAQPYSRKRLFERLALRRLVIFGGFDRQEYRSITIGNLLGRWERGRSPVTVTDLRFRMVTKRGP